jgi:hypothetical protein
LSISKRDKTAFQLGRSSNTTFWANFSQPIKAGDKVQIEFKMDNQETPFVFLHKSISPFPHASGVPVQAGEWGWWNWQTSLNQPQKNPLQSVYWSGRKNAIYI